MKILMGQLKGRNFFMPAHIRPTQNMVRKAIFDIIGHDMSDLHFLDLFAGSGAVGLEAYSCGAQSVTMVEREPKCAQIIEENMKRLGINKGDGHFYHQDEDDSVNKSVRHLYQKCQLIQSDVFAAIKSFSRQNKKFNVVFIDPPYDEGMAKKALKTLGAYDILQPNSFVIVECGKREGLTYTDHDFTVMTQRKYGKSYLVLYQKKL